MRKKARRGERLEACGGFIMQKPEELRGNWGAELGGRSPLFLEIGCGKGSFISALAGSEPGLGFIAAERSADALISAAERAGGLGLANLRFLYADASRLGEFFAPGELGGIYINFPDPWPKNRHWKRRLTSSGFLALYRELLAPGGEVRFKTDSQELFGFSVRSFSACGYALREVTYDLPEGGDNTATEYELRFRGLGVPICSLTAVKP